MNNHSASLARVLETTNHQGTLAKVDPVTLNWVKSLVTWAYQNGKLDGLVEALEKANNHMRREIVK